MDPSIVSGLSAVLGSLVGGSASIATAWFTQRAQSRREAANTEIAKREKVYGEFISECSRLTVDSLDHTLDDPKVLIQVYGLLNRIKLTASDAVIAAAAVSVDTIVEQYFQPPMTMAELRGARHEKVDPLHGFSDAARKELMELPRLF